MWIRKDYESTEHEVGGERERVIVNGEYKWKARTLCGRTIVGVSGGSAFQPECLRCQKSIAKLER